MKTCKVGILGSANIAANRFLPALKLCSNMQYIGIASRNIVKAEQFAKKYGGKAYDGYEAMIADKELDAIYIPLPPALHYEWTKRALLSGKHVIVEKPIVYRREQITELCEIARERGLVLCENYMFVYHEQINYILERLKESEIGKIRLIQCKFGFPHRSVNDFRYNKQLGGGALLDCGGYTVKLASILLGNHITIEDAYLNYEDNEVDLYGSVVLRNQEGLTAQLAFGMDNDYKCELEIWGSNGVIKAPRVFTASVDDTAKVLICRNGIEKEQHTINDNHFLKSIQFFMECYKSEKLRAKNEMNIITQVSLIEEIYNKAMAKIDSHRKD